MTVPRRPLLMLREWTTRLWGAFHSRRDDRDLEEELRLHLALAAEDARRRGHSPDQSTRDAAIRAGGISQAMEALRAQRGLPWVGDVAQDVGYAVRTLRRSPSFTTVSVLTLALGIGATTTIYSVVDTILLRPLPFTDSDRIVRLLENVSSDPGGRRPPRLTYQQFSEWRTHTRALSDAAVFTWLEGTVRTSDGAARLVGGMVSGEMFTLFGTRAVAGRTLITSDEADPNVVVLGFDTWQRYLHASPDVVGTTISLRVADEPVERRLTVVGVLPANFEFPAGRMDFYTPLVLDEASRVTRKVTMLGRLAPGVTAAGASDEANVVGKALISPRPANAPPLSGPRFAVETSKEHVVQELRPALRVLLASAAVLLMIVCANVASLVLARGSTRHREIAVRFALGASRQRITRLVLTECLVLAAIGRALGALVGAAGVSLVLALASVEAPGVFRQVFGDCVQPRWP